MKKICLLIVSICLISFYSFADELPYPIIFIHGLESNNKTWDTTIAKITELYGLEFTSNNVFHACLNAYKDMTRLEGNDGVLGTFDDDVMFAKSNFTKSSLFSINFETFWNQNSNSPMILLYPASSEDVALGESRSNQASIVKQGFALSVCIKEILKQTGAEKVILMGHSMGGLCSREYLQRRVNSKPKCWIDPNSPDGHKIAKLVTLGTPHFGSNVGSFGSTDKDDKNSNSMLAANLNSDAVRDLRYSYASGDAGSGRYLFGGSEDGLTHLSYLIGGWHNRDVDCNGSENDEILGINTELQKSMPLPTNIPYHWITSKMSMTSGDGIVDLDRQFIQNSKYQLLPLGITDSTLTNRAHWKETTEYAEILRGLDEPGNIDFAYNVKLGTNYIGMITYQQNYVTLDADYFKYDISSINLTTDFLSLNVSDDLPTNQGQRSLKIELYSETKILVADTTVTNSKTNNVLTIPNSVLSKFDGTIYLKISSNAKSEQWRFPYRFNMSVKKANDVDELCKIKSHSFSCSNIVTKDDFKLSFSVNKPSVVLIDLYDFLGRRIKNVLSDSFSEGNHFRHVSLSELNAGLYFLRMSTEDQNETVSFIKLD